MSRRLFALLVLMSPLFSQGQIDQKRLDSLSKSIDSSAAARSAWQDSFTRAQDSVYQQAISKTVDTKKRPKEQRQKEVERQRTLQGLIIALAIVIAVVLVLLRRKKKST